MRARPVFQWIGAATALALLSVAFLAGRDLLKRVEAMDARIAAASEKVNQSAQSASTAAERAAHAAVSAAEATKETQAAEGARVSAVNDKTAAERAQAQAETVAAEANRQIGAARADIERLRKEREAELDRLQQVLDRIVETRRTSSGMVMNLPEKALHFDFDSSALHPESRELLSRVAGILLASGGFGLAVHGHTDDVGTSAYNQRLSEQRAESVKRYLADAGISAGMISAKGFGKSSPVAPGPSEDARAKNRRVEIVLTDTRIKYLGEAR